MQLAQDTGTDYLLIRPGSLAPAGALSMARGNVSLAVQFCVGSVLTPPAAGTQVYFGLKAIGSPKTSGWLSLLQLQPVAGSVGLFSGTLQNNTPEMVAATHADPADTIPEIKSLPVSGQLYYILPGSSEPNFSQLVNVAVTSVLWTGLEGIAPSPVPVFPSAAALTTAVGQAATALQPNTVAPLNAVSLVPYAPDTVPFSATNGLFYCAQGESRPSFAEPGGNGDGVLALLSDVPAANATFSVAAGYFLPENYGATSTDVASTTAGVAAAILAAQTAGGGTVILGPRPYNIDGQVLGALTAADTNVYFVSLEGRGRIRTVLNVYGPPTTVGLKFSQNAYSRMTGFTLNNLTGSQETTEGIQLGGFSFGNASQSALIADVYIVGFYRGIHTSSNTGNNLSGSTTSETLIQRVTLTNCYEGIRHDDYNAQNVLASGVDTQACNYGFNLLNDGLRLQNCSAENNVIDINNQGHATANTLVWGFRSEGSGLAIQTNHPMDIIGLDVVSNNPNTYPLVTEGAGTFTVSGQPNPSVFIYSTGVSIRSSMLAGPVAMYFLANAVSLTDCVVAGNRLLAPCSNPTSGSSSRYDIRRCYTAGADFLTNLTAVPDRKGTYTAPNFVDDPYTPQTTTSL